MPTPQKQTGDYGEKIAKKYLENRGYIFVAKNFHAQGGEIDLIMQDTSNQEFVFIEVKTRRSNKFGSAKDAITKQKVEKMMYAITHFFNQKDFNPWPEYRIEAICLRLTTQKVFCEHIKHVDVF